MNKVSYIVSINKSILNQLIHLTLFMTSVPMEGFKKTGLEMAGFEQAPTTIIPK